ncbi:MAG: N-6 DNA methylase, partial [Ginsengibacter sp.]
MLTAELQSDIDNKWEACMPINQLRPLVLLDLLCYLLFIKKINEDEPTPENAATPPCYNPIYIKEQKELRWNSFKDMEAHDMHKLFIKEKGVLSFIKDYGNSNNLYSVFLKPPLLLTPTPILLGNITGIIKIIEAVGDVTKADIYEYLINKVEISGQNWQVYAPEYITKLIVALMKPESKDIIWDPSAGNGSFLVKSAMYLARTNPDGTKKIIKEHVANKYM